LTKSLKFARVDYQNKWREKNTVLFFDIFSHLKAISVLFFSNNYLNRMKVIKISLIAYFFFREGLLGHKK